MVNRPAMQGHQLPFGFWGGGGEGAQGICPSLKSYINLIIITVCHALIWILSTVNEQINT